MRLIERRKLKKRTTVNYFLLIIEQFKRKNTLMENLMFIGLAYPQKIIIIFTKT